MDLLQVSFVFDVKINLFDKYYILFAGSVMDR